MEMRRNGSNHPASSGAYSYNANHVRIVMCSMYSPALFFASCRNTNEQHTRSHRAQALLSLQAKRIARRIAASSRVRQRGRWLWFQWHDKLTV
jgi:hypothetical protein